MSDSIDLNSLKRELDHELKQILQFWATNTPDILNGGFAGKIDNYNNVDPHASKGSVLNARILWSFSAAYKYTLDPQYLEMAHRAYHYINTHFIDKEHGGVYWTVDENGQALDTKKQVYAVAFTIYALSEYYQATNFSDAKQLATDLFRLLIIKSYDNQKTGFFEAFTREWDEIDDLRLSVKDANEKKTMNTHLHVLEAFSNLYKIWKNEDLKNHIITLIHNFLDHIIDRETNHLNLFFDEDWNNKSGIISFGHDIESSWLLLEAAECIEDHALIEVVKNACLKMAEAACLGLDPDGSMYYEFEPDQQHWIKEKHWWVQAEAMVGFFNAWQIGKDPNYLRLCYSNWDFIKDKILDKENGEWFWGILPDGTVMPNEDKAGMWKCPYHNSRACLEIISRISQLS